MARGSRRNVAWPAHVVRRHARTAALAPLPMAGIGVLATLQRAPSEHAARPCHNTSPSLSVDREVSVLFALACGDWIGWQTIRPEGWLSVT